MSKLYPLKFKPVYKEKIWGGQKINTVLGRDFSPLPNCGEVWVLSGVEGNQTQIEDGFLKGNELNEMVEIYMGELVGDKVYEHYGTEFPILIKFIDANDWLSIQVHPDDELAMERHGTLGKTEMWYILNAEEKSELISGFSTKVSKEEYIQHLEKKTLKKIMNFTPVEKDDVFYIPAGRVHALGPGILLAEIQQTSDNTYRIYDWDRIDKLGMVRDLHTDLALDALDFNVYDSYKTNYEAKPNETAKMVESQFFTTNIININQGLKKDYSELDSFIIYIASEGNFKLIYNNITYIVNYGEVILIPACVNEVELYPDKECKILEVYIT